MLIALVMRAVRGGCVEVRAAAGQGRGRKVTFLALRPLPNRDEGRKVTFHAGDEPRTQRDGTHILKHAPLIVDV